MNSDFLPMEFEGVAMWTPEMNWHTSRKVRDESTEQGYYHLPPEEFVLQMFRDIDVPSLFVRPRVLPVFEINDDGIKRVKDDK